MAIVRCEQCGLDLTKTKRNYVQRVNPLGYPETGVVCGRKGCRNPGFVWLEKEEYKEYQEGERIFRIPTYAAKIKVE